MQTQTEFEMIDVDSSNLAQIGYDRKSKTLRLKFHDGDAFYDFRDVPPRIHRGLMDAQSKGHYFRQFIQYRYNFQKMAHAGPVDPSHTSCTSAATKG